MSQDVPEKKTHYPRDPSCETCVSSRARKFIKASFEQEPGQPEVKRVTQTGPNGRPRPSKDASLSHSPAAATLSPAIWPSALFGPTEDNSATVTVLPSGQGPVDLWPDASFEPSSAKRIPVQGYGPGCANQLPSRNSSQVRSASSRERPWNGSLFDPEFERRYDEAAEDAIDKAVSEEVLKGTTEEAIARGVARGRAVADSLKLGFLKNGDRVVNIGGFFSEHVLAVSEKRVEDATDNVADTSRGEDLEDWLKCKLAFHRRVEAESQGKRIPAPDTRSESERVRPSEDLDDELTEIDVKAIVEVLEGSPAEVVARALENRTSTEGRALAAAYARKRRGEKCLGVQNVAPDPPFTAPPPRSPGGSACAPSDNGNVHRGGGRGLRATVPAWITHPQISPSSSGETRRGDSGAFARQSKEDREDRDE
jgi:hypothetical protein